MSPLERFFELLREWSRDPRELIPLLWIALWLWSVLRRFLERARSRSAGEPPSAPPPSERPREPAAPRTPSPARRAAEPAPAREPRPRPPARATERPRQTEDVALARALERAYALRRRVEGDRALGRLAPIVADHVIAPLQAAQRQAGQAQLDRAAIEDAARAAVTLGVLERVVRERERDPERLAEVDAIAEACHAPLRAYARAKDLRLRGAHPVAVRAFLPDTAGTPGYSDELLLLAVPAGFGAALDDYVAALHELGRAWYSALPGLAHELPRELGLPPRVRLLDARTSYDVASVRACFGAWLPALFADAALALRLGDGYVSGLRKSLAADGHVTRGKAEGAYVSSQPPGLLRLRAAEAALAVLGEHGAIERHRAAFAAEHEAIERAYLPLAGGRALALDSAYLLEFTDEIAQAVLHAPLAALGGVPLVAVPGFAQTLEARRDQQALARALADDRVPDRADPARLVCGALLAWDAGLDPELARDRLQRVRAPRVTAARAGAAQPARERRAALSLRAALRDRAMLRDAIALGAALERPRFPR